MQVGSPLGQKLALNVHIFLHLLNLLLKRFNSVHLLAGGSLTRLAALSESLASSVSQSTNLVIDQCKCLLLHLLNSIGGKPQVEEGLHFTPLLNSLLKLYLQSLDSLIKL